MVSAQQLCVCTLTLQHLAAPHPCTPMSRALLALLLSTCHLMTAAPQAKSRTNMTGLSVSPASRAWSTTHSQGRCWSPCTCSAVSMPSFALDTFMLWRKRCYALQTPQTNQYISYTSKRPGVIGIAGLYRLCTSLSLHLLSCSVSHQRMSI